MEIRFQGVTATDHRKDELLVIDHEFDGQAVRSSDEANLGRAGTTPGRDYAEASSFKFTLMANQRLSFRNGIHTINSFLNVWRASIEDTGPGKLFALDYRHGHLDTDFYTEPWKTIFGVPDYSDSIQLDEATHRGFPSASFTFRQTLPGTFGPEQTLTVEPDDFVDFQDSHGPVIPILQFNGPFTNPSLTLGNLTVALRGSAGSNDYWIVDPFQRTITDRFGRNDPTRASRQTMLSRIRAEPLYRAVELVSVPSVDIRWRPFSRSMWEDFEPDLAM